VHYAWKYFLSWSRHISREKPWFEFGHQQLWSRNMSSPRFNLHNPSFCVRCIHNPADSYAYFYMTPYQVHFLNLNISYCVPHWTATWLPKFKILFQKGRLLTPWSTKENNKYFHFLMFPDFQKSFTCVGMSPGSPVCLSVFKSSFENDD